MSVEYFRDQIYHGNGPYICGVDNIHIKSIMRPDEFLSKSHDVAIDMAIGIFEYFNWNDPPKKILGRGSKKIT